MSQSVSDIFVAFQEHIDAEQDLREEIRVIVRSLEQTTREAYTALQGIHQPQADVPGLTSKSRELLVQIRSQLEMLAKKVEKEHYYRFHDHWRFVMQRLVLLCALLTYLEEERLIQHEEATKMLGVSVDREKGFHVELDDFLMGLLMLADELARFSVNCVTSGDYNRPVQIAKFVTELNAGFRLLNLKNDSLRKRFDALKYDLKRVEEVVYDLSIRGLKPK